MKLITKNINDIEVEESNDYEISYPSVEIEDVVDQCDANKYGINGEDDEDEMSFCEVGFVWQLEDGDEDWCLV